MNTLNPSIKHHTIIGALLGVWGLLFAYFIRPFEHGVMDEEKWILVSVGFSIFVFVSYVLTAWIQKQVYQQRGQWSIPLEVATYIVFFVIYAVTTFVYYRSSIISGIYDFPDFCTEIILKIVLVVTPILLVARRYAQTLIPASGDYIRLRGENKLDVLKIKQADLVCISNAQNYVEIFYVHNDEIKSKLLRNSLKQIEAEFDFLIRIHRSHLINPIHFQSWVDAKTISLKYKELPVAKNYKKDLLLL